MPKVDVVLDVRWASPYMAADRHTVYHGGTEYEREGRRKRIVQRRLEQQDDALHAIVSFRRTTLETLGSS